MTNTLIERDELIARLLDLPAELAEAEAAVLEAETTRANLATHGQLVEDQLLLAGQIDGKNAEQRAAQLRAATVASRGQQEEAERILARRKIELHRLTNQFSAYRAITRLIAGRND